jgi:hypothetical protein
MRRMLRKRARSRRWLNCDRRRLWSPSDGGSRHWRLLRRPVAHRLADYMCMTMDRLDPFLSIIFTLFYCKKFSFTYFSLYLKKSLFSLFITQFSLFFQHYISKKNHLNHNIYIVSISPNLIFKKNCSLFIFFVVFLFLILILSKIAHKKIINYFLYFIFSAFLLVRLMFSTLFPLDGVFLH